MDNDPSLIGKLSVVTFFITNRCNARCETCFYWKNLNNADEMVMSLEEIDQVSKSMPPFNHLLFSGGEPVMRKEMVDIAEIFYRNNKIISIDMPTNGLLSDRVGEVVNDILDRMPDVLLTVGLSLDGLEETHNKLRGVPGNWVKSMKTLETVGLIRTQRMEKFHRGEGPKPKLRVMSLTCINNQNIDEVESLANLLMKNPEIDGMMFECLRGQPKDECLMAPSREQFDQVVEMSIRLNEELYQRRFPEYKASWLSYIRNVYRFQRSHLVTGELPTTCQAGNALAVIEPDGRVRLCELLEVIGDLREVGLNWSKVWLGDKAVKQRQWIREAKCSCTHCVNMGHTIDSAFKTRARRKLDEFLFR